MGGECSPHGVVPQLSPAPRKVRAAARAHHHDGLSAGGRSGRDWAPPGAGIQDPGRAAFDQLFDLPPMSDSPKKLDLAAVRARLEEARGRDYWRSLEDLAAHPEFQELV